MSTVYTTRPSRFVMAGPTATDAVAWLVTSDVLKLI